MTDDAIPRHVYVWQNGQVLTFDETGAQIPSLQVGDTLELRAMIEARADQRTEWHDKCVPWDLRDFSADEVAAHRAWSYKQQLYEQPRFRR